MSTSITVRFGSSLKDMVLSPVPMSCMPSSEPELWNIFCGVSVEGASISIEESDNLQEFMIEHRTEALTNGCDNFTILGGSLAFCSPEKFSTKPVNE